MPSPSTPGRSRGRPGYDRSTVLSRAIDLFNRRGYDATSVNDLAADLGISKSAIYHHFPSKDALLAAALADALEGLDLVVEQAGRPRVGVSAYDRLRETVRAAVHLLVERRPAVTLLLRVRGNSPVETEAMRRRRAIDARLADLVTSAADESDLRSDMDPTLISRLIFGMVNSLTDWYRPGGVLDVDELADDITTVLFHGLTAPDDHPAS